MKKALSIILIIVLLAGLGAMLFTGVEEKKAIIILPGLGGSAFYGVEDGRKYWDPLEKTSFPYQEMSNPDFFSGAAAFGVILELTTRLGTGYINGFSLDEDSIPVVEMRGAIAGEDGEYGPLSLYKQSVQTLQQEFGNEYDVILYNFDFRRPIKYVTDQFEQFIQKNGYNKIVLIGHSMGGVVGAEYLARSQANRNKVALNIGCGVPYFGTHTALVALDSPVDYIAGAVVDSLADLLENMGIDTALKKVLQNMGGIFDLMPFERFLDDPALQGASFLMVDGNYLDYEQSLVFMENREFALRSDGKVKSMFNTYKEGQYNYFINGKHSTELVNSHYIVGKGFNTLLTLKFNDGNIDVRNSIYTDGDAVVTPYEGVIGLPFDSPKVTVLPNVSHIDIISEYDNIQEVISLLIKSL